MRSMNISGTVASKDSFLGLLRALSESRKTGVLVVKDGEVERRLFFEQGEIIAAASTGSGESFGEFLVEKALIQETELRNAEHAEDALLGRRLVELGVITEEEIQRALRVKIKHTIAETVAAPFAKFEFVDDRLPAKKRVPAGIDTGALLSGGLDGPDETLTPRKPPKRLSIPELEDEPAPPPAPERTISRAPPRPRPSVSASALPERDNRKLFPIAAGVATLGLALAGYWWLAGEAPEGPRGELAAPMSVPAGETEPPSEPEEEGSPRPAPAPVAAAPRAETGPTASSSSSSPPARAAPAEPPRTEPVPAPAVETPRTAAVHRSPSTPSPAAPPPPPQPSSARAERSPAPPNAPAPPPPTPPASAASGSTAAPSPRTTDSEPDPPPAAAPRSEPSPARNAPQTAGGTGWESAIFAPKNTVVVAEPASAPAVARGELVKPGPEVTEPVLVEHPKLSYPGEARRRKIEAVVRVRVLVDENGKVLEANVDEPVGHGLDEAAIKVALKARFIPATKGTVQVKMWTELPLVYRLDR